MSKTPALFLDRDGVVNKELGHAVCHPDDFILLSYNFPVFRAFIKKSFKLIIISNQSVLAKKQLTSMHLQQMHRGMKHTLKNASIDIDGIFYCPHHPDISGACLCRKPNSLLFEKAIAKYDINPEKSLMIGDQDRDIAAAKNASVFNCIKIDANQHLNQIQEIKAFLYSK